MVRVIGFEPIWDRSRRILSPLRLPISPYSHIYAIKFNVYTMQGILSPLRLPVSPQRRAEYEVESKLFLGHGCGSFFPHGAEDEVRHFHAVVKFYGFAAYVHAVSLRNALRGKVIVADDRVYFLCA